MDMQPGNHFESNDSRASELKRAHQNYKVKDILVLLKKTVLR